MLSPQQSALRLLLLPLCAVAAAVLVLRGDDMDMPKKPMQKPRMPTVFPSHSSNLTQETALIAKALVLAPGKAYCEVGGANGLFFKELAPLVMPGGAAYGTGATAAEADAVAASVADVVDATTFVAQPLTSGLPPASCDALLLRMVYHMLSEPAAYLADFRRALKPGGKLLLLEHDSDNGATGRMGAKLTVSMNGMRMNMSVVPPAALLVETVSAGFKVETTYWPKGIVQPW
jgi:SAM-dependent methyltransferase